MSGFEDAGFVGRASELARLAELVETARLVTVVGPPGAGKSRLVARWAATTDAMVVDACDTSGEADFELEVPATGVLVIDNVDHVIEVAATRVIEWLRQHPALRIVVTSRERIRVTGEHVLELGALQLPEPRERDLDAVLATEAAQLLVARAPALVLQPADAPLIADLLHRLDGLPLAIELAAARATMLDLGQLAGRLDRRFDLLATGARDASVRHGSLWDAVQWSWELLSPVEQVGLAQCSVFRNGFSLVAAEALVELGPGAPSVLDVLQRLVDRSLVRVIRGRELRFRLYDSIRDFAAEQLARMPGHDDVLDRHGQYFQLARWMTTELVGQEPLRSRIARDVEDLAAAFERNLDDPERLARITSRRFPSFSRVEVLFAQLGRLGPFWLLRRTVRDAVTLATTETGAPATRSAVFRCLGNVAADCGMLGLAQRMFERAFAEADLTGTAIVRGHTLFVFGSGPAAGDREARCGVLAEALAIARELDDTELVACTLVQLGMTYFESARAEEAITQWDTAVELMRRLDWHYEAALILASRGIAHQEQARFAAARRDLEAARAIHVRRDDAVLVAAVDCYLARLDHECGAPVVIERYRTAIDVLASAGARGMEGACNGFLGAAEAERGELVAARTAFATAELAARTYGSAADAAIVETLRALLDLGADRTRAVQLAEAGDHPSSDLRLARRLLRRALADTALVIAGDGAWFRIPNGREVNVGNRPVLRNLLVALACGDAVVVADLIAAGWPGEAIHPTAAANRLHVALTTLRNLGLRDVLVRQGDAYRLRIGVHRVA
ncbi:MAG: hypothetical protein ABI867_06045 [Kofleriaceae bacterium]